MQELIKTLLDRQESSRKRLDMVFYLRAYALRFLEERDRELREDYSTVLDRQFQVSPDERGQFLDLVLDEAASGRLLEYLDEQADRLVREVRKAS